MLTMLLVGMRLTDAVASSRGDQRRAVVGVRACHKTSKKCRDNRTVPGAIIMRFSFRLHLMIVEAYSTPICCHNTATQHTIYMKRKLQS